MRYWATDSGPIQSAKAEMQQVSAFEPHPTGETMGNKPLLNVLKKLVTRSGRCSVIERALPGSSAYIQTNHEEIPAQPRGLR